MSSPPIVRGSMLGEYRVGGLLGQGGMGSVYRATDAAGATVVLKLIHPEFAARQDTAARFAREASITAELTHPAIDDVLSAHLDGPQPFIAMEYVDGRTLGRVIEQESPLGAARSADLIGQTLAAVTHAHAHGIMHRDLKPANVMVCLGAGGTEEIKILDFGIAGLFDEARQTRITQTGQVLGTPGYLSPEQAAGGEVDGRADLWAVGVMLYAMLAKALPFPGDVASDRIIALLTKPAVPISTHRGGLPEDLVEVLDRLLTKDLAGRYQTAEEAGRALAAAIPADWDDGEAPFVAPVETPSPPSRRSPTTPARPPAPAAPASQTAPGRPIARPSATAPPISGPATAKGRPAWHLVAGLISVFSLSLVAGGALMVAFSASEAPPREPAGGPPAGSAVVTPVAEVEPVEVVALAEPAASATADRGPAPGQSTGPGPGGDTAPAEDEGPAASEQRDPVAHEASATRPGCPNGVRIPRYSIVRSERISGATAGKLVEFAFLPYLGVDSNLRAGTAVIEVSTDQSGEVDRVRFPVPGPLTPQLQAALRRRLSRYQDEWLSADGRVSLSVRLLCL